MTIQVYFTITDAKGAEATHTTHLPDDTPHDDALYYVRVLAQSAVYIVKGKITAYGLRYVGDLTLLGDNNLSENADVEEGALFTWETANGYVTRNRLATFDEAYLLPGSNVVDDFDNDVLAYVTKMTGGAIGAPVNGSVPNCDRRGDLITTKRSGFENFQLSR